MNRGGVATVSIVSIVIGLTIGGNFGPITDRFNTENQKIMEIMEIPDQSTLINQLFTLDLQNYVEIDNGDTTDIQASEVTNGGGSITDLTYTNTFTVPGIYVIVFRLSINSENWSFGVFRITVGEDLGDNVKPSISLIPDGESIKDTYYVIDLSLYLNDDRDEISELDFALINSPGEFAGSLYYHIFESEGEVTINFRVTDTAGADSTGNFSVNILPTPTVTSNHVSMSEITAQITMLDQPFQLNLTEFIVVPESIVIEDVDVVIVEGLGTIANSLYSYTFESLGNETVVFGILQTDNTWSYGLVVIQVKANTINNNAPVINPIPSLVSNKNLNVILDLSSYVQDDFDTTEELVFDIISGLGYFVDSFYINNYTLEGNFSVIFSVTDISGSQTQANFLVEIKLPDTIPLPITILGIPDQQILEKSVLELNLSSYVQFNEGLNLSNIETKIIFGLGSIQDLVYNVTYPIFGNFDIIFKLRYNQSSWQFGIFSLVVQPDFGSNQAPTITAIPTYDVTVNNLHYINLNQFISDDHDQNSELNVTITSGLGSVLGMIYYHNFTQVGGFSINFNVTDSYNATSQGSFVIFVNEALVQFTIPPNDAILVSNFGTDHATCGTFGDACKTITYGIGRADQSFYSQVIIAEGIYNESIVLMNGISLIGGYNSDLNLYNIDYYRPHIYWISSSSTAPTISAISITNFTEIEGLTVYGAILSSPGSNSYGIYIRDSDDSLYIHDVTIFGGRAANGLNGQNGLSGSAGGNGSNGAPPKVDDSSPNLGANGGTGIWGGDNVSGGNGGTANTAAFDLQQGSGTDGIGISPGLGGSGGWGGDLVSGVLYLPSSGTIEGQAGLNGAIGLDRAGGSGASPGGTILFNYWLGNAGTDGSFGTHGSGGGGGGAGGGYSADGSGTSKIGGSGGGAGAGGQGGEGGIGGKAGGSSFGIIIVFTSTPLSMPAINETIVYLGVAGNGGSGGNGAIAGPGGTGGFGGTGTNAFAGGNGGNGGNGGRGGHGAGAGGGSGGFSYGFFVYGYSIAPNYELLNLIYVSTGVAGTGGNGGIGFINSGTSGADGTTLSYNY